MGRRIAQIASRRPSAALLAFLFQQVQLIDRKAALKISRKYLGGSIGDTSNILISDRLSEDKFAKAYHAGMAVIVDWNARRRDRTPMTKVEYDLLCHCIITCETLGEAIRRTQTFMHALACRPARIGLSVADNVATFDVHTEFASTDAISLLTDLAWLGAFHRLFAWLIDQPIELLSVELNYSPLIDDESSAFIIPFPICYNSSANLMRFSAQNLDHRIVRTPEELRKLLKKFPFDVNDTHAARDTLRNRVRSAIATGLSRKDSSLSQPKIASQLGISLSTLKRHLHAEGTSFREIREELLYSIAQDHLNNERYSVTALSAELGFSDVGSFRHAFKRWAGYSPGRHRINPRRRSNLSSEKTIN